MPNAELRAPKSGGNPEPEVGTGAMIDAPAFPTSTFGVRRSSGIGKHSERTSQSCGPRIRGAAGRENHRHAGENGQLRQRGEARQSHDTVKWRTFRRNDAQRAGRNDANSQGMRA